MVSGGELDPVVEGYKRGVDRTLLRENPRRTPEERLRELQRLLRLAADLQQAGRRLWTRP
ncbi:MAG: hypothetical protein HRF46_15255 [Acidobacteriota bacterium]|jgi:hypothetical protein